MIAGTVAEVVAWRLVVGGRRAVWRVMTPVFAAMGAAALILRPTPFGGNQAAAAGLGLATGLALYLATRVFVTIVRGWPAFSRGAAQVYARGGGLALPLSLILALVAVVGEELFWRGLFQGRLSDAVGPRPAGLLAWLAFAGANVASGNLAVLAGAVVGGGVWAWLVVRTGGILASVVCHATWTLAMIAVPPFEGRRAA